jgi:hypothetical protein
MLLRLKLNFSKSVTVVIWDIFKNLYTKFRAGGVGAGSALCFGFGLSKNEVATWCHGFCYTVRNTSYEQSSNFSRKFSNDFMKWDGVII